MVPYDRPHVMEGVVGILLTARRLLDAGERRIVGEHVLAVPTNCPPEGAFQIWCSRGEHHQELS